MRFKTNGNKRDGVYVVVKNAESSATIPMGSPVCLKDLNGTDDGVAVVLPATVDADGLSSLLMGVVVAPGANSSPGIPPGGYGEAQVFGFCPSILMTINTRSASTASWTSQTSIASGGFQQLIPETVCNGWTTAAPQTFVTGATTATALFANFQPYALLGQSLASQAASASATSDTRTCIYATVKGFLRMM